MSDYDDADDADFGEAGPSFADRERLGAPGDMMGLYAPNPATRDPQTQFRINVNSTAKEILSNTDGILFDDSLSVLDTLALAIPIQKVANFNATAFVLGYIASNAQTGITDESFAQAIDVLKNVNFTNPRGVKDPDVLRYAIYIMSSV